MGGQLANAQGNSVVPQGSLQQPAQQPQPMQTMTMPITQTGKSPSKFIKTFIVIIFNIQKHIRFEIR